ncbi:hypothetical protein, partial [Burkholderia ubonensis]|uniref:hypothetical protein n=1 Tax=Burkholderia ubonensis TaxID=101571 RepID=UPI001E3B5C6F
MTLTIPVVAAGETAENLADALSPLRAKGIDLAKSPSGGLAVDPGTISLIVEVAKVTLPALLSAIATIWAARIGQGGRNKSAASSRYGTRMVLELNLSAFLWVRRLNKSLATRLRESLTE